jgi:hypothetical protein
MRKARQIAGLFACAYGSGTVVEAATHAALSGIALALAASAELCSSHYASH